MRAVTIKIPFSAFEQSLSGAVMCMEVDNLGRSLTIMIPGGPELLEMVPPYPKTVSSLRDLHSIADEAQFKAFMEQHK